MASYSDKQKTIRRAQGGAHHGSEREQRDNLLQWTRERFQWTEDAIVVLEPHFGTPTHEGRTIGDEFWYLTAASRIMPERIRALRDTGELPFPGNEEIADAVAKFASLDCEMLRIELDAAHRDAWMGIRCFSDEDLGQTFTIHGKEHTLGTVIRYLVMRETVQVNAALEAAGIPKWDPPFIGFPKGRGPSVNRRYRGKRYFELRATEDTKRFRHPDFEMFAARSPRSYEVRHFATLVEVSGDWWLDLDGKSLTAHPTPEDARNAAWRDYDYATCKYCGKTGYYMPRSDGSPPRPYWVCPRCWKDKKRKQDALRRRRSSRLSLLQAKRKAQKTASRAAQTALHNAIEAAEAAGDTDALEHLKHALPHIEAATRSVVR